MVRHSRRSTKRQPRPEAPPQGGGLPFVVSGTGTGKPKKKPSSAVYTDKLVKNDLFNWFILWFNIIYIFTYRNLINLSLESRSTLKAQLEFKRRSRIDDDSTSIGSTSRLVRLGVKEKRQSGARKLSILDERKMSVYRLKKLGICRRILAPYLSLPSENKTIINLIRVTQIILILRYFFALYELNPTLQKRIALTSTRTLLGYDTEQDRPKDFESFLSGKTPPTGPKLNASQMFTTGCDLVPELMNLYVKFRYNEFQVRNFSLGIGNQFWTDHIFPEQHDVLQLFVRENCVAMWLLAIFYLSCLFGVGLILSIRPLDVPVMAFMFEPKFIAFSARQRLMGYLRLVSESYKNYWAAYRLSLDGTLLIKDHYLMPRHGGPDGSGPALCPGCRSAASSLAENPNTHLKGSDISDAEDTLPASLNHFDDYLPLARTQAWRRLLLMMHPILQLFNNVIVFAGIIGLFVWYTGLNISLTRLNYELKSIISGRLGEIPGLPVPLSCFPEIIKICDQFKVALTDILMDRLRRVNPLWRHNLTLLAKAVAFPSDRGGLIDNEEQLQLQLLEYAIRPYEMPVWTSWTVIAVGIMVVVIGIALYATVYIVCLCDIWCWLVELRFKMDICAHILKFYQARIIFDGGVSPIQVKPAPRTIVWDTNSSESITSEVKNSFALSASSPRSNSDSHQPQQMSGLQDHQVGSSSLKDREYCNLETSQIADYVFARHSHQTRMAADYAQKLVELDRGESLTHRQTTDKFLTSTYLDFRLFQDEINDCRPLMNLLISVAFLNGLNLMACGATVDNVTLRLFLIPMAFIVTNCILVGACMFQSHCAKLHNPILSILAASNGGDRKIRHQALLWRKTLTDLTGPRTKFAFKVHSLAISYTATLQLNLSIASLFLLTFDKSGR